MGFSVLRCFTRSLLKYWVHYSWKCQLYTLVLLLKHLKTLQVSISVSFAVFNLSVPTEYGRRQEGAGTVPVLVYVRQIFFHKRLVLGVNIESFCPTNMVHRMLCLCFRVWVTNFSVSMEYQEGMSACCIRSCCTVAVCALILPLRFTTTCFFISFDIRTLSVVCHCTRLGYKHRSVVQLLILSNVFSMLTPLLPT